MMYDVIIVGGGAAGIISAISAAKEGASVLLLEKNRDVGKKLLATGNGRCNYTNQKQGPWCYHSDNPLFPWEIVQQFPYQDTLRFFTSLGLFGTSKDGYFYPYAGQAKVVVEVLKQGLNRENVEVKTEVPVKEIRTEKGIFCVITQKGAYQGKSVVVATGGKAMPASGSTGDGYVLAKHFGHAILPTYPALVKLICQEKSYRLLGGIRAHANVSLWIDEELFYEDTGEILFTKDGISGIPTFQISRFVPPALEKKQEVEVHLDFMPEFSTEELIHFLQCRGENLAGEEVRALYLGLFPEKLSKLLNRVSGVHDNVPIENLTKTDYEKLARPIKYYRSKVVGTYGFNEAQVTSGGVDTTQIRTTMESELVPGLFWAGEVVDVDGKCGGYNLQWAWSSGYIAGRNAAQKGHKV